MLTVPLSVSYGLVSTRKFGWFVGANIAAEWLLDTSEQTVITSTGTERKPKPDLLSWGRHISVGYGAQTTLRYQLTPVVGLQLEPAWRIYSSGSFPTKINGTHQFQGLFAVLFKV